MTKHDIPKLFKCNKTACVFDCKSIQELREHSSLHSNPEKSTKNEVMLIKRVNLYHL